MKRYNLDCHVYARSTTAVFEICDFMNYDSGIVCLGLLEMEEQDEKAYRKKYETGKSGLNVHHNKMGD